MTLVIGQSNYFGSGFMTLINIETCSKSNHLMVYLDLLRSLPMFAGQAFKNLGLPIQKLSK